MAKQNYAAQTRFYSHGSRHYLKCLALPPFNISFPLFIGALLDVLFSLRFKCPYINMLATKQGRARQCYLWTWHQAPTDRNKDANQS